MPRKQKTYFDWLLDIVERTYEYGALLKQLYGIPYFALVPNDENRGADGIQLRTDFYYETGSTEPFYVPGSLYYADSEGVIECTDVHTAPCSVLEMLIGVAKRVEFDLFMTDFDRSVGEWFWVLIDNLGLSGYDDSLYFNPQTEENVAFIVHRMLQREYECDGSGGLFPIKSATKDMRRVEVWYQMSDWLNENYWR